MNSGNTLIELMNAESKDLQDRCELFLQQHLYVRELSKRRILGEKLYFFVCQEIKNTLIPERER